jgi:ketosteroid isomerase-like protein
MVLPGCHTQVETTPMNTADEKAKILKIVDSYTKALDSGDAALWEGLYWLDDKNFSEIENDKPYALDRRYIEQISAGLRRQGPGKPNQRWHDTKVYVLSPDIAYSVSLRDEINTSTTSRVTLVYQKKRDEWRIIHGHFSDVPK